MQELTKPLPIQILWPLESRSKHLIGMRVPLGVSGATKRTLIIQDESKGPKIHVAGHSE